MKIKDFLQDFWKESRSKKRGQSVKYADCPRLHYAVCVMQINGLFLSAQPEASKCRDLHTLGFEFAAGDQVSVHTVVFVDPDR